MTEMLPSKKRKPYLRLLLLALFLVSGVLLVLFTPLGNYLKDPQFIYEQVKAAKFWGGVIFVGIFVVASVFNIPGTFLVVVSMLIYGVLPGALIGYIAAVLSAAATFYVGRMIGGQSLKAVEKPWIKRLIIRAERKPIQTIILLRTLLQFLPLTGFALALTKIDARMYMLGNILGMLVPVFYISLALFFMRDWVLGLLGIVG